MSFTLLKVYGLCHFTGANVLTDLDKHNLHMFSLAPNVYDEQYLLQHLHTVSVFKMAE